MGKTQQAREILRKLESGPALLPRNRAFIYVALGEKQRACEILNEPPTPPNMSAHSVYAMPDPAFDSMRGEPCFQAAIAKVAPPRL